MIDLIDFNEEHPNKIQLGYFPEEKLKALKGKVPEQVIDFLIQEGECTYGNGFFRTVLPDSYHNVLSDWGLDGDNCYVFLQTALGSVIYFFESKFYDLHPFSGRGGIFSTNIEIFMNSHLTAPSILNGAFWMDFYLEYKPGLPELLEDDVYAVLPPIPKGGSKENSKPEVVKRAAYFAMMSELNEHRIDDK